VIRESIFHCAPVMTEPYGRYRVESRFGQDWKIPWALFRRMTHQLPSDKSPFEGNRENECRQSKMFSQARSSRDSRRDAAPNELRPGLAEVVAPSFGIVSKNKVEELDARAAVLPEEINVAGLVDHRNFARTWKSVH
jgi:hypothetical protein